MGGRGPEKSIIGGREDLSGFPSVLYYTNSLSLMFPKKSTEELEHQDKIGSERTGRVQVLTMSD